MNLKEIKARAEKAKNHRSYSRAIKADVCLRDREWLLAHINELQRVMWQISPAFAELMNVPKEPNDKT